MASLLPFSHRRLSISTDYYKQWLRKSSLVLKTNCITSETSQLNTHNVNKMHSILFYSTFTIKMSVMYDDMESIPIELKSVGFAMAYPNNSFG